MYSSKRSRPHCRRIVLYVDDAIPTVLSLQPFQLIEHKMIVHGWVFSVTSFIGIPVRICRKAVRLCSLFSMEMLSMEANRIYRFVIKGRNFDDKALLQLALKLRENRTKGIHKNVLPVFKFLLLLIKPRHHVQLTECKLLFHFVGN